MSKCAKCLMLKAKIEEEKALYDKGETGEDRELPDETEFLKFLKEGLKDNYELTPQLWLVMVAINELREHQKECES
jgi:hypothetical protein